MVGTGSAALSPKVEGNWLQIEAEIRLDTKRLCCQESNVMKLFSHKLRLLRWIIISGVTIFLKNCKKSFFSLKTALQCFGEVWNKIINVLYSLEGVT